MVVKDPVSRWPLVGRESELAAFTAAWANLRCQGVVISGPAGVGKSRLAEECLARAVRDGWKGGQATASKAAAAVPLGAIAHLIPAGVTLSDPVKSFAAVTSALAGPQRHRRVLWVDDLHLLDATSAVLLRQMLDAAVLRLIATVRAGEPVGDAVQALTGGDTMNRIDLDVFGPDQLEAVLQSALGGPVGQRALHEMHAASGGNVLYLRELVTGALQAGTLASDGEIWELIAGRPMGTPKLAELIGARLASADLRARPVLELLAVCEPVALADVQTTASLGTLAGLEEAGLVQVISDRRRTTLRLAHPLYGEALREGLSAPRRRSLLLAQAERTEASGARRRDDALHTATWRLAATGTADPALLVQAAALARHAHDYPQTITLLQALPEQEHTSATLLLLGEAQYELGHFDDADDAFAAAHTKAGTVAEAFAITLERTQNLFWTAARVQDALAVNAEACSRTTDPAMREALTVNEGAMRVWSGEPYEGLALLTGIEDNPDERVRLYGLALKVAGLGFIGRAEEAVHLGQRAYAAHREATTIIQHPASQLLTLALAYMAQGDLQSAHRIAERAFAETMEVGAIQPGVWSSFTLARTHWLAGRPTDARRCYAQTLALARDHHLHMVLRLAASGLAASAALQGDIAAAEAALADFASHPSVPCLAGEERLGEAWLLAAQGRIREARAVLTEATRAARDAVCATSEALLLTDIARLGGPKEVAGRLAELAEACDGVFAPARAHLAAALATEDPDRLLTTAGELEQIGADLLAAEAANAAAALWRRTGQPRRAAAAAQRAQACAARCQGARTPLLGITEVAAALTAREREIALLAASGTSSKDIAATLHLSVRTVDNHLQHAYAKLGVTTRRELADTLG
ncbi:LuxR C-terminal-related transcriptional regulator [Streptomyces wedmorensis]